ncbi:hypothetical protein OG455_27820 [Kitasatospora sp. NBC_01287]|uniref:hypothetical protein n=1 Tax=Kitasatospora sp. NBC_01287 TaxID=2903573 RepID=UPI0022520521|nr:hypothetical protein [Kitasatospora sp. NBC_01287]MCX4749270.1 hypothetical protein [Kitasatospora sp. NBC_01287]
MNALNAAAEEARHYANQARSRAAQAGTDLQRLTLSAAALTLDSVARLLSRPDRENAVLDALSIAESYATSADAGPLALPGGFTLNVLDYLTA